MKNLLLVVGLVIGISSTSFAEKKFISARGESGGWSGDCWGQPIPANNAQAELRALNDLENQCREKVGSLSEIKIQGNFWAVGNYCQNYYDVVYASASGICAF